VPSFGLNSKSLVPGHNIMVIIPNIFQERYLWRLKRKNMKERNLLYITGITFVATLGGLLFGYDTAVISGAEKSIQEYLVLSLGLNTWIHGATISSALIGCIIGGVISGFMATGIGRKKTLLVAAGLFFLSALGSSCPEFLFRSLTDVHR
jgi:SP family xylose:H+ symportor-like MFS transporter